ncbi:hypothetical protein J6590_020420 [Homalodisca vitripennis]|nr:hypothetical protein J6590_020420 [Homalodisca vitripennis]
MCPERSAAGFRSTFSYLSVTLMLVGGGGNREKRYDIRLLFLSVQLARLYFPLTCVALFYKSKLPYFRSPLGAIGQRHPHPLFPHPWKDGTTNVVSSSGLFRLIGVDPPRTAQDSLPPRTFCFLTSGVLQLLHG